MDRPHGTQDRITADAARRAAQARAARAAAVARRAAAARRRALLAGVLVLATVVGWAAFVVVPAVGWVAGVAPTVLLSTVLVLGRRAVLAGREADAEWEARIADERRVAGAPAPEPSAPSRPPPPRPARPPRHVPLSSRPAPRTLPRSLPPPRFRRFPRSPLPFLRRPAPPRFPRGPPRRRPPRPRRPAPRRTAHQSTQGSTAEVAAPQQRRESTLPFVTGRAIHPSDASTEVFERIVEDQGETGGPARHSTGAIPVVRRSAFTEPVAQVEEPSAPVGAAQSRARHRRGMVPRPRPASDLHDEAVGPAPGAGAAGEPRGLHRGPHLHGRRRHLRRTGRRARPSGDDRPRRPAASTSTRSWRSVAQRGSDPVVGALTGPTISRTASAVVLVFSPLAGLWRSW